MNPPLTIVPPVQHQVSIQTPARDGEDPQLLGPEHWHLRELQLEEQLDAPYTLTALLITEDLTLNIDHLLGAEFSIEISREGTAFAETVRPLHGLVLRADYLGTHSKRLFVRVVVGPALALLAHTRRSRIFQDHTAAQVVDQVVRPQFEATGRSLQVDRLVGDHPKLDYCVQWRETDLEFVQRILADAGITYAWDHQDDRETMVLLDDDQALPLLGERPTMDRGDENPPVVDVLTGAHQAAAEGFSAFQYSRSMHTGTHEAGTWDWKLVPPTRVSGMVQPAEPEPWQVGEICLDGARRLLETEDGQGPHLDPTLAMAERALARAGTRSVRARGVSTVHLMSAGATFELGGHPHPALDGDYVAVQVTHRAEVPAADVIASDLSGSHYENNVVALPRSQPYRPELRPRPDIQGPQLGTVVGPHEHEIHTDPLGRVRVLMHWDRQGAAQAGHMVSCWLRVAQSWAGPGYGTFFLPRVGMEVIVQFIDGDPDRPVVTGCVHNAQHPPAHDPSTHATRSYIKTASSPGGVAEGFNELRFEDARGSEEIYIHAERNLREQINNGHRTNVGGSQSITVHKDRTKTVKGDEKCTVQGSRSAQVGGGESTSIGAGRSLEVHCGPGPDGLPSVDQTRVHGERTTAVQARDTTVVGSAAGDTTRIEMTPSVMEIEAARMIVFKVGESKLVITPNTIEAYTDRYMVTTEACALDFAKEAKILSDNAVKLEQSRASMVLRGNNASLAGHETTVMSNTNAQAAKLQLGDNADLAGHSVRLASTQGSAFHHVNDNDIASYASDQKLGAGTSFKINSQRIDLN